MLQISFIRENKEEVLANLAKRGFKKIKLIEELLDLDEKKRKAQFEKDALLAKSNKNSFKIADLIKSNQKDKIEEIKKISSDLKSQIKILEIQFKEIEKKIEEILLEIPNFLAPLVKEGKEASDNEIIYQEGEINSTNQNHLPHWELAQKFGLIDFELGAKISASGFPVYKDKGAKLKRALIDYFLDQNIQAGYLEYSLPFLVNQNSVYHTGQFPDKEAQMYFIEKDNLYLIPTSEVPLMNCFAGKLLEEKELPIKVTSYSPCFRREAGSYGSEVRGLNRLHQFDKVEIIQITKEETSNEILEEMINHVKKLLQSLKLPFRILRLCSGDTGFSASITYDFEVYCKGQKKWLEVSSVSNCKNFQSSRLKLRYKTKNSKEKTKLAHSLNGSALALPRIMAALLENYQKEDGIEIPEILRSYMKFDKIK